MKKYMGFKLVEAEPAFRLGGEIYIKSEGYPKAMGLEDGYMIRTKEWTGWSGKEDFEKEFMQIGDNNSVTQEMIDYMIDNAKINVQTIDGKTTIVHCVLPNGFTMVESSSCVDPNNYDEKMGKEICIGRMKTQLWGLLGFLLQTAKEGIK